MSLVSFESWELILQFVSSGLTKLDETIGYCWCPIVMRWSLWLQQRLHHCDVIHWDNKAVSQWLLTFNLCVSVTWPLTCAFHIPCTHTPEIIDMHRGVCDNTKAPHHWPLWGEDPSVTGGFSSRKASNAENVSIWWRHHVLSILNFPFCIYRMFSWSVYFRIGNKCVRTLSLAKINLLVPTRCGSSFTNVIFEQMLRIKFMSTSCENALRYQRTPMLIRQ